MEERAYEIAKVGGGKKEARSQIVGQEAGEREIQHDGLHSVFMSVFQQMMMGGGWGPAPYPPYPSMRPMTPPFKPHAPGEENKDNPPTTSR